MVAKNIWLILIGLVVVLTGCQTVSPLPGDESSLHQNQPEDIEVPTVSNDVKGPITGNLKKKPVPEPVIVKKAIELDMKPKQAPDPQQVVTRLQKEAIQLQSEGRWSEAELKLERALRINAEKVDIYHQLATVRMGQQRFVEAEQIALKGLTFTDQSSKYKASLWDVIAQCRSAQGDIQGAKKARQEMIKWMVDDE